MEELEGWGCWDAGIELGSSARVGSREWVND